MKSRRVVVCAVALVVAACTRDALLGSERLMLVDAGAPDATTCVPTACGGHVSACGDCADNDGDGKVDLADPDCLGPCQDSEGTFVNPQPGQGHGACALDCYFDGDDGFGNDDCEWSHVCDPLAVAPDFPPEGMSCAYDPTTKLPRGGGCDAAQSDKCRSVCGSITPRICDCFGCCLLPGASTSVFIGSVDDQGNPSCDSSHEADPTRCEPCTQVTSCLGTAGP
ncbi:MAG TPA: hypothetical protein VH062_32265 [Polyangiaceae bacterium]|jgi:hypothetical protein|nr:hypothetical protein [Polyangiaceae bacterium]